jgi:hypothetical protein
LEKNEVLDELEIEALIGPSAFGEKGRLEAVLAPPEKQN